MLSQVKHWWFISSKLRLDVSYHFSAECFFLCNRICLFSPQKNILLLYSEVSFKAKLMLYFSFIGKFLVPFLKLYNIHICCEYSGTLISWIIGKNRIFEKEEVQRFTGNIYKFTWKSWANPLWKLENYKFGSKLGSLSVVWGRTVLFWLMLLFSNLLHFLKCRIGNLQNARQPFTYIQAHIHWNTVNTH